MLDHNQLTPEEAREQNQPLIQDLRRYYNTRADDNVSLAHIQTRLLEKTAASLPVTRDDRVARPPLLLPGRNERHTRREFAQVFAKDRLRYRSLGTLAAATLLVALIGSFALLSHLGQGMGAVERGWSLVAKFSGTGNQTITGQNIEVGQKFGWRITCTNTQEGVVAIKYNLGSGSTGCSANRPTQLGPVGIATSPIAFPPIQTIEVTTNASTSWELLFFRATDYQPLTVNTADWQPLLSEMNGTGNSNETLGNTSLPRTLALQFVCHGTGDIQISLLPNGVPDTSEIAGARAPCNGQTNFDVTDIAGQSEKVFQVQITTGADNDWQVLLAGCTNGKPHCGLTTVTSTSTP